MASQWRGVDRSNFARRVNAVSAIVLQIKQRASGRLGLTSVINQPP
jgi:hypothetical protein